MSVPTTTTVTVTPRRAGDPQPDLGTYHLVHVAMRRSLHDLAALATDVRDGRKQLDRRRAGAVQRVIRLVTDEIHRHHDGEERLGWPIIAASAGSAVDLGPLTDDHSVLDPMLASLRELSGRLVAGSADRATVAALASELVALRDLLDEHIEEEERELFPIIREYVSVADYESWERQLRKALPMRDVWFIVHWVAEAAGPEVTRQLLAEAELPFRVIHRVSKGRYARLRRDAFGS
jgi:hemerythrin-like domain-containing protein